MLLKRLYATFFSFALVLQMVAPAMPVLAQEIAPALDTVIEELSFVAQEDEDTTSEDFKNTVKDPEVPETSPEEVIEEETVDAQEARENHETEETLGDKETSEDDSVEEQEGDALVEDEEQKELQAADATPLDEPLILSEDVVIGDEGVLVTFEEGTEVTVETDENKDISENDLFVDQIPVTEEVEEVISDKEQDKVVVVELGLEDEHLTFSKLVTVIANIDKADGTNVTVKVKHEGQENFSAEGITLNPEATCENGISSDENNIARVIGGEVVFYTCGASTFVLDPDNDTTNEAVLWLKADAGTSTTTDGGSVSQWDDQSGNAHHASQGSASEQPTYRTDGLNFHPKIEFNATTRTDGDYLEGPDDMGLDNTTTLTTFFVGQQGTPALGSTDDFFTFSLDDTVSKGDHRFGVSDAREFLARDNSFGWQNNTNSPKFSANPTQPFLFATNYDGSQYVIEERVSSNAIFTAETSGIDADQTAASNYRFGRDFNDSFDGDFSEVVIYDGAFTATERVQVQSYLATKYGLTLGTQNHDISISEGNYLLSDGTVSWDSGLTANPTVGAATWNTASAAAAQQWQSVGYGNGRFVSLTNSGSTAAQYSDDGGLTWSSGTLGSTNTWIGIAYGEGRYVAVGTGTGTTALYSDDGITWNTTTIPNAAYRDVTYGNGRFVAVQQSGGVAYSDDGITWTSASSVPASNQWNGVAYGDGKFVAVAGNGTDRVMYSTDGDTWTAVNVQTDAWYKVRYGNGKFVAVGTGGTYQTMHSPDGINWTPVTAAEANVWRNLAYGAGIFVAVAQNGTNRVMYSLDGGVSWVSAAAAEANNWQGLSYGEGRFVAASTNGTNRIMYSDVNEELGYHHDVFGLGRDDDTTLDQRVSRATASDDILTLALDNDFTSANNDAGRTTAHSNDLQALMVGNDDGDLSQTTVELPAGYVSRLNREWQAQKTANFGETVNMKFDGYGSNATTAYYLISDADGDFATNGDQTVHGALDANGEITSVALADGDVFTLAAQDASDFIITVKTDNAGTSASDQFTIPTISTGYNYNVDCDGDGTDEATGVSGDYTCDYSGLGGAGTYTVKISGSFPRIYFNNGGDKEKILTVEQWGTNSWISMISAFYGASNLVVNATDAPDLSGVTSLQDMFRGTAIATDDLSSWDTSTITSMRAMFRDAPNFNSDISNWDTSAVMTMAFMFDETPFNQDISGWNTGAVDDMQAMFRDATAFNQDIGTWNTANVTTMANMFDGATAFNGAIGAWNTSSVMNFVGTFRDATAFNQDIGNWNTSSAVTMQGMFNDAVNFDQDISFKSGAGNGGGDAWDVSGVTTFLNTFSGATAFNQDIGNWDTGSALTMATMFADATSFNQDLSGWDTADVGVFAGMFDGATAFNQDVGGWNTASATDLSKMFDGAIAFDQDLGSWDVEDVTDATDMFNGVTLSVSNYDSLLNGWAGQTLQSTVPFSAGNSKYCQGNNSRADMIATYNWAITDAGPDCSAVGFITTWKTDNPGTSNSNQITIPTGSGSFNYIVEWGDGNFDTGVTGDITHTYAAPGTYTVTIYGAFPHIQFANGGDKEKILSIEQWGDNAWDSMFNAFNGAVNLVENATDAPDLASVTNMSRMFTGATSLNQDLSNWDTFNVQDMSFLFQNATAFNSDISNWNTSSVTNMRTMFAGASIFNQDIGGWETGQVTSMTEMFQGASAFNQDISFASGGGNAGGDAWDVSGVQNMSKMFVNAAAFNQDIGNWDTGEVLDFDRMFNGANTFNQDIGGWDTRKAQDMSFMFASASAFNQDIGGWETSAVTDMRTMFQNATSFDQDISTQVGGGNFGGDAWDVSGVTNMFEMFQGSSFNQDIGNWDTGEVLNMGRMFSNNSVFNQDIGSWNTGKVANMDLMFSSASAFDQNIGGWDVTALTSASNMFLSNELSLDNYDALLIGWDAQALNGGVPFSGGSSDYCLGQAARANMISSDTWAITDGDFDCPPEVSVNQASSQADPTNGNATFTAVFNEAINVGTFTGVDVDFSASTAPGVAVVSVTEVTPNNGTTFDIVMSAAGEGDIIITIPADGVDDPSGKGNNASTSTDNSVTIDLTAPSTPAAAPDLQAGSDLGDSSTDDITSDNTPTFDVTCTEVGATITLYSDNPLASTVIGTHTCVGTGTESAAVSPAITDGVHNVTYSETDPAGNESGQSASLAVTIDTAAPVISEVTPVPTPGTDNTPDYTFTTDETGTLGYGGGCDSVPGTAGSTGNNTVTLDQDGAGTALADGVYDCTLTVTDAAGNVSNTVNMTQFIVDTTPPNVPSISLDTITNGIDDPIVTFSALDNIAIDRYTITYNLDDGGVGTGIPTTDDPVTSPVTLDLDPDETIHTVIVTVYDTAGNSSSSTVMFPPVINITAPTTISNTSITDTTFTVSTPSGNDLTNINVSGAGASGFTCTGNGGDVTDPYANPVSCTGGTITTTGTVTITAEDSVLGAVGQNMQSYIIETNAPNISITAPTKLDNGAITDTTLTITDDTAVNAGDVSISAVGTTGSFAVSNLNCTQTSVTQVDCTLQIDDAEGTGDLRVDVTDVAGNTAQTDEAGYEIDKTAPAAPGAPDMTAATDTGSSSTDNLTSDTTPDYDVVCAEAGSTITLYVGGSPEGTAVCPSAAATVTITPATPHTPDGIFAITATETDSAGNESAQSTILNATIDTAAPTGHAAPDLQSGSDSGSLNNDDITADNTPTFDVTCTVVGAAITLYSDIPSAGTTIGTHTCVGTGTEAVTASPAISDGVHNVTYTETDPTGNVSAPSPSLAVTIDTGDPAAPSIAPDMTAATDSGVSNTDNITNDTTPDFDVVCDAAGTVVTLYTDNPAAGTAAGTYTCVGAGTETMTATTLPEATQNISYTHTDLAGNESVASPSLSVTIDDTSPNVPAAAPDLQTASDTGTSSTDDITSDNTPTFDVTCTEVGATITLYSDNPAASTVIGTHTCVGTGTESAAVSPAIADGVHNVTYSETDLAGNESGQSASLAVTIDTAAPVAPTPAPDLIAASDSGASDTDDITSDNTPTFDVTCGAAGDTITLYSDNPSTNTQIGTHLCVSTGTENATASPAIVDGVHNVSYTQTDQAGNESPQSGTLAVTIDTAGPASAAAPDLQAPSDTGTSSTDDITSDNTPTFDVTCTGTDSVTLYVDQPAANTVAGTGTCSGGTVAITLVGISDGNYNFHSTQTDTAGNEGAPSPTLGIVVVDTNAPATPVAPLDLDAASDANVNNDDVTSDNTPTFGNDTAINCTDPNIVTIYTDHPAFGTTAATGTCSGGVVVLTTSISLVDGVHNLTYTETDLAGNESGMSPSLAVTVDTNVPATPVVAPDMTTATDTGVSDSDDFTADDTPDVTVNCTDPNTVTIYVGGSATPATGACSGGTATITLDPLAPDGTHTVTFTETDLAGNESAQSPSLTITTDTATPAGPFTLITPPAHAVTQNTSTDIDGSCGIDAANGSVTVTTNSANGFAPYPGTVNLDASGNFTISGLTWAEGVYDLIFACVNQAGGGPTQETFTNVAIGADTDGDGTIDVIDEDDDGDGNPDTEENVAPNDDGNGDGIPDRTQEHVASTTNPDTGAHTTLDAVSGDCRVVDNYGVVQESSLSVQDPDYDYPVGLNDFTLVCGSAGQSSLVVVYYDQVYDTSNWVFRKFDANGNVYSDISDLVTFGTANVNGTNVTTASYTVTDGPTRTDTDGSLNARIVDPAGPAVAPDDDDLELKKPKDLALFCRADQIALTWTDRSEEENGHYIQRKVGHGGAWKTVHATDQNDEKWTDTDVVPGEIYYYAVRSYKGNETSKSSAVVSCTTSGTSFFIDDTVGAIGEGSVDGEGGNTRGESTDVVTGDVTEEERAPLVEGTTEQAPEGASEVTATSGDNDPTTLLESCASWPWFIWAIGLVILIVLIAVVPGAVIPFILAVIGLVIWWFFDDCRNYLWFPLITIISWLIKLGYRIFATDREADDQKRQM